MTDQAHHYFGRWRVNLPTLIRHAGVSTQPWRGPTDIADARTVAVIGYSLIIRDHIVEACDTPPQLRWRGGELLICYASASDAQYAALHT